MMRHEGHAVGQDRSPLSPGTQCAPAAPSARTAALTPATVAPKAVPLGGGSAGVFAGTSPATAPASGVLASAPKSKTDPLVTAAKALVVIALVGFGVVAFVMVVVFAVRRVKWTRPGSGRSRWVFGEDGGTYHMFGGGGDQQLMPTALAGSGGSTMFERVVVSNDEPGSHGSHGAASSSANGSKLNGAGGPTGHRDSSEDSPSFVGTMTDIPLR